MTLADLNETQIEGLSKKGQLPTVRASFTPAQHPVTETEKDIAVKCMRAAIVYGTNASYLLALGYLESALRPQAASSSGAFGLFQLSDASWRRYVGANPDAQDLDRQGVDAQCLAAAYLSAENQKALAGAFGRQPSAVELYMAHLFGVVAASKLGQAPDRTASAIAALGASLPNAGAMLRAFGLRGADNSPPTVEQVFVELARRLDRGIQRAHWIITALPPDEPFKAEGTNRR